MKLKVLAACLAVVSMLVVPGAMSAQADDEARSDAAAMVAEAVRMDQMFIDLYNARKFEELGARYYAEDAIALPPNTNRSRVAPASWSISARPATASVKRCSIPHP